MKARTASRVSIVAVAVLLAGCATRHKAQVWTHPELGTRSNIAYSIAPFEDANAKKDKEDFPDAAIVVKDAFETAFLQAGYRVVNEGNADAIVTGTVQAYYRGKFAGRETTVGWEVKATDSESGEILWKASNAITTGWNYNLDPSVLAGRVAQELVQGLPSGDCGAGRGLNSEGRVPSAIWWAVTGSSRVRPYTYLLSTSG